jgi:hypothetical protein
MLMHVLVWGLVLLLWGLWSLTCWLGHATLGWAAGQVAGGNLAELPPLTLPEPLAQLLGLEWLAWARELMVSWGPTLQGWLAAMPDLSGWVTVIAWLSWTLGSGALLLLGLAGSGTVALTRRYAPKLAAGRTF